MALQDLTPELRTRMSRVERLVGLFILLAGLLVLVGFAYYLRDTGKRRGWFVNKVPYYCYTRDANGLKAGDPVRLLGRVIGRIVQVETNPLDPWFTENNYTVTVKFEVHEPHFGYIFDDSTVHVVSADFFGARLLEVAPGDPDVGLITVGPEPRWEDKTVRSDDPKVEGMVPLRDVIRKGKGVWLKKVEEAPALASRVEEIVRTLAEALPSMNRQLDQVLTGATTTVSNVNLTLTHLQPSLTNLQALTERLGAEDGVIGRMVLTTNLQGQVSGTLASMESTLTNTTSLLRTSEIQLQDLTRRIALTLDNVALVTSNLSAQVNANSLMLGEVSSLVVNADDMLQGLKRHWLLRSAFGATATNPPIESIVVPSLEISPR
ncbi:MAG: MlaD family protein [Limisphaerales bacterium]